MKQFAPILALLIAAPVFGQTAAVRTDYVKLSGIGVTVQPHDDDLDAWALLSPPGSPIVGTSSAQTLDNKEYRNPGFSGTPTFSNAGNWRSALDLEPGVDVQAFNATLSSIAAGTPVALAGTTITASTSISTADLAYDATSWNGSTLVPTRNAVRDQFELLIAPTFITQTPSALLAGEQAMSALATGLVKNTTSTGVQSIAVAGTDYLAPAAIGVTLQAYDADLDDLADGSLTGSKVSGAVTMSGGTVNSSVIGGTTPAAITGTTITATTSVTTVDAAYNSGTWDGDNTVPTKNAVRDQIQLMLAGGGLGTGDIDTSAELRSIVTDETGTGSLVFATSPTLTTPNLGTPSAITLTNGTGLPIAGLTGLGSGVGTLLATPSSANLAAALTDESGSGVAVFATSPTLVTPNLGTPSAATLTNATGLPIASGVSGLGTGIATMLATPSSANVAAAVTNETGSGLLVFATSPALTTPNLGTPSAATLTNATGLPISTGVSGLGANVATALATPSSSNFAAAITDETGTGSLVLATSPSLTTPNLGTPSAATLTNATGLPISTGVSGLGTGVATLLATPSSANLATAITGETGSGAVVFGTSPTIATPTLTGTPSLNDAAGWRGQIGVDQGGAPVVRISPNGTRTAYGVGAANATAVGTAALAAQTAASAGDVIEVWQDAIFTASIGKNGVDWFFGPIRVEGTTAITNALIADDGSAKTFSIAGNGRFWTDNRICFNLTHADSDVTLVCDSLDSTGGGKACVEITAAADVRMNVLHHIHSEGYDGIVLSDGASFECDSGYIGGWQDGLEMGVNNPTAVVRCRELVGEDDGFAISSTSGVAKVTSASGGAGAAAVFNDGGDVTWQCPAITGRVMHQGGTTRISGARIASPSGFPTIDLSASGLTLDNCSLVTDAGETNSISGTGTITVLGGLAYNKAVSGVTLSYSSTTGNALRVAGVTPGATGLTALATTTASGLRDAAGASSGVFAGSTVAAATSSAQGASELATSAEVTTGSDTTRTITPDALRASDAGKRIVSIIVLSDATAPTVADKLAGVFWRVPAEMNGWELKAVAAAVDTGSTSGTPTFRVRRRRLSSTTAMTDAQMLSTQITLDAGSPGELDSKDASSAAVIDTSNDDVQTGDRIFVDCTTAGTGTKGLSLNLTFQKP